MLCGEDVRISPLAYIAHDALVELGSHVAIDPFVVITTALKTGNYVHIAPHVTIIGGRKSGLVMEDFCFIAAGCRLVCGSDDYTNGSLIGPTIPRQYRSVKT